MIFITFLSCFLPGAITLLVVVMSHKCKINPDNVATPIAASLGDVTTLGLLAAISSYLYNIEGNLACSYNLFEVGWQKTFYLCLLCVRVSYYTSSLFILFSKYLSVRICSPTDNFSLSRTGNELAFVIENATFK